MLSAFASGLHNNVPDGQVSITGPSLFSCYFHVLFLLQLSSVTLVLILMITRLVITRKHVTVLFLSRYVMSTQEQIPGPSCSKLTMSLVNNSLKFTSSDTQIC